MVYAVAISYGKTKVRGVITNFLEITLILQPARARGNRLFDVTIPLTKLMITVYGLCMRMHIQMH